MAKHTKMYENSPKIETDGDGKKVVTRGEKKSEATDAGTDGMALHQKHAKERLDLHHKHEKEHHELHAKHMKEGSAGEEKGESKAVEKAEKEKGVE
jgi:hypothetical protein